MIDSIHMIRTVLSDPEAFEKHENKVSLRISEFNKDGWKILQVHQNIIQGFAFSSDNRGEVWLPEIVTTLVLQIEKRG